MSSKYSVKINELHENTSHEIILDGIRKGSVILECGSSSGYMTQYMKEKLQAKVSIVEINQSDYDEARVYADDGICANLEGTEWIKYYQGKQFDYILFADVLEHLRNPSEVLKRAVPLLKEDGVIITSIPNVAHHDILINMLSNQWNYMPLGILDNTHVHFWAEQNLDEFFTGAGLTVVRKDYAILPAFGTEQRSKSCAEGLMPAVSTICNRKYGDVYQFVFFSQKTEFVTEKHIPLVDLYDQKHKLYDKQAQVCANYQVEQDRKAAEQKEQEKRAQMLETEVQIKSEQIDKLKEVVQKQSNWIDKQDAAIRAQNASLEIINEILKKQLTEIEQKSNQLTQYQNENVRLNTEYLAAKAQFDDISNAFFWKCTKPLRSIVNNVRAMFAKGTENAQKGNEQTAGHAAAPAFYTPGDPMTILATEHTSFVAKLIQNALKQAGIPSCILTEEPDVYGEEVHIVICPQMFSKMPGRYIAFQMEQTVSSRWLTEEYSDRLNCAFSVLDYSLENIKYFREKAAFGKNVYYLPVDYLPGQQLQETKYEYDVLFYGDANNERRKRMIEALQQHFSVKVVSEVFGDELYQMISKAKVVVNIHYYEKAMLETTRIYEVLSLGRSMVVSERSSDPKEEKRLNDIVDFVPVDNVNAMVKRIGYWLAHEKERIEAVNRNNKLLMERPNAFLFYFCRFLLAHEWITFDRFYELAGNFVHFNSNRVCLSLPEATDRRAEFDKDNRYGFEVIPGLRHARGWTGCGLSYKFIMKKAKEQNMPDIVICEDDVLFPDDFERRWANCIKYLTINKNWDIFQGLMADVGKVHIQRVDRNFGQTFVHLDHMVSTVFNYYKSNTYDYLINWDEKNADVHKNTIDRALEAKRLKIIATTPFLVGHKEDLNSEIWGFKNTQYKDWISKSSEKLERLVAEYEEQEKQKKRKDGKAN